MLRVALFRQAHNVVFFSWSEKDKFFKALDR